MNIFKLLDLEIRFVLDINVFFGLFFKEIVRLNEERI